MNIILSGSLAIDRIMNFKGRFAELIQPDKLHVLSLSILLDNLRETRGGVAGNIAYNLALLGEKPVLLGSVGEGARLYMEDLGRMGVDVSAVHYSELPTATFTVMTDQDDCQVGGFYPGAMGDASSLSMLPYAQSNPLVVVSPHDPSQMARQVDECKKNSLRLFYDVGQQANNIDGEDIKAGIEAAELLIVNDYEMGVLEKKTGWSQAEILSKVKTVIVTLGEKGCTVFVNAQQTKVGAIQAKKVVDPTGAGDAFRAGFLYGYVRGWEPVVCAELGATVAVYAVETAGTQEHRFTLVEVEARYRTTFQHEICFQ